MNAPLIVEMTRETPAESGAYIVEWESLGLVNRVLANVIVHGGAPYILVNGHRWDEVSVFVSQFKPRWSRPIVTEAK